ncbi:hypothetical protein HGRIS_002511 [Hohenbuehelia grisea]|uniref:Uncharacterized protein n=1 Tax=Hohenbuehelia grisea TaxID=104357 RepID=A0ABR3JM27_9AGAR
MRDQGAASLNMGEWNSRKDESDDEGFHEDAVPASVASNAWPVLACFIKLFERDEVQARHSGGGKSYVRSDVTHRSDVCPEPYSQLLLEQVPAPRANATKWDVSEILDVIFYCFEQPPEDRRILGSRLMAMLMNLVSSRVLDVPMVINSIYKRVSTLSEQEFSAFIAKLEQSPSSLCLKIVLLHKYLTDALSSPGTTSGPRPKPQARAQPRPVRRDGSLQSVAGRSGAIPESAASASAGARKSFIPSAENILQVLGMKASSTGVKITPAPISRLKFELFAAYGTVQSGPNDEERDPVWPNLLREGRVRQVMATLTEDQPPYQMLVTGMIDQWLSSGISSQ